MRRLLLSLAVLGAGLTVTTASHVSAAQRNPIVFVHGWSGDSWNWAVFMEKFKADGYTSDQLFAWDYDHTQSNVRIAEQLDAYIDQVLATTGARRVDIVTHSMGGLSSRYFLKNLDGASVVDDWVSIGGPNHGTEWAHACFDTSCTEMRPGSTFLTNLNSGDETPGNVSYFTFWSPCDEIINPDQSVVLNGAANTKTGCIGHLSLLASSSVYRGVRDSIA